MMNYLLNYMYKLLDMNMKVGWMEWELKEERSYEDEGIIIFVFSKIVIYSLTHHYN